MNTPLTDPTTGEPITDLGPNNFTIDQFGAMQACELPAPPQAVFPEDLAEVPFDFTVDNLGNGLYVIDMQPSPGCVGAFPENAFQVSVVDGIRQGHALGRGFAIGPFCTSANNSCPPSF